ncbi:MAG: phosphoglycerate kinase [Planctomycetota bacterium]|nr:phosphoglycerate kinase [Planctomycetota bacterium]MEE3054554.1 phosphoglycerate kinase [Planctomycetota bacterium]
MRKLFVTDLDVRGKRVLVRADFNVPLQDGEIIDDRRIRECLPTIQWLMENGARTILMSHLGRPGGERAEEYSLQPVALHLGQLLRRDVPLANDCVGPEAQAKLQGLADGGVLLLENLRFHAGETANEPEFAQALAALAEIYVNDAFGTSHRSHASITGVAERIAQCAMGFLLKKELDLLGGALADPRRPFVAIMGGSKVSGKIKVIENLLDKVDQLIVGGGMSYTIFKAMGLEIGKSLLEESSLEDATGILEAAEALGPGRLILPLDILAADAFDNDAVTTVCPAGEIPAELEGLDIGPRTIELYGGIVREAGTVIWNGPMGVFEMPTFARGTESVASAMAEATARGATTIVGGGDSAAAIKAAGLSDKISHVSTGGGASLKLLEGGTLPGVAALCDQT